MATGEHVVLVTGGGRGIGEVVARRIAREGATVLVAARSKDECKAVADSIRDSGGQAWPLEVDVGDDGSVARALDDARMVSSAVGPVDWLVNNAGCVEMHRVLNPKEEAAGIYERLMNVNFQGARRLTEAILPDMARRGYGRVVNMASSAGLVGYANLSAYCASKFALVGYTRALAKELEGVGVNVNAVCPHYVQSPMIEDYVRAYAEKTDKGEDEWREYFRSQNPGGRLVTMEECADAVWEALVEDYTGRVLELDGSGAIQRS